MSSENSHNTVTIIGLGNIGTQLLALLLRVQEITRLILVDPDRYEHHNLVSQNIRKVDVGTRKVDAMAHTCSVIRPDLDVITYATAIEDVPLTRLRADIMASCVDSRSARQTINLCASRLDMPWVDAAVQAENQLGRFAVYQPQANRPCLECRWGRDDYALLDDVYQCNPDSAASARRQPKATAAPAELGALVAAYQAMAIRQLLSGDVSSAGRETFINAHQHIMYSASFAYNAACCFDHQTLSFARNQDLDQTSRIAELIECFAPRQVSVEGHAFVFDAACQACRSLQPIAPRLTRSLTLPQCPHCGEAMVAAGHTTREKLPVDALLATRTLADIGLCDGDVLALHQTGKPQTLDNIFIEIGRQHV